MSVLMLYSFEFPTIFRPLYMSQGLCHCPQSRAAVTLAPVYEFYTTCNSCHVVVYLIAGTWDRMNALHYTPCLPSSGFPSSPFIGPPSPPGFPVSSFSLPAMFDHSGSWDNPDLRWVEQQQLHKWQICFL